MPSFLQNILILVNCLLLSSSFACTSTTKNIRTGFKNPQNEIPPSGQELPTGVTPSETDQHPGLDLDKNGTPKNIDDSNPATESLPVASDVIVSNELSGIIFGNGGEILSWQNNPWFFTARDNPRKVFYCIDIDSKRFSLKKDVAVNIIEETLREWGTFYSALYPLSYNKLTQSHEKDFFANKWFATTFALVSCDTSSTTTIDLQFNLGNSVEGIEKIRHQNKDDLVALAYLNKYSTEKMWANGAIWFAPDLGEDKLSQDAQPGFWTNTDKFKNVLYHELGHIFGLPHDSLDFMKTDQPAKTIVSKVATTYSLSGIILNNVNYWDNEFCLKPDLALPSQSALTPNMEIDKIFNVNKAAIYIFCFKTTQGNANSFFTIKNYNTKNDFIEKREFPFIAEKETYNKYFTTLMLSAENTYQPVTLGESTSLFGILRFPWSTILMILNKTSLTHYLEFKVIKSSATFGVKQEVNTYQLDPINIED